MPADPLESPEPIAFLARKARAALCDRFDAQPAWIASAPGRVNLIGEHTDYNAGLVLPMAIDRACVVAGAPAQDQTTIIALDHNDTWQGDLAQIIADGIPATAPIWARYPLGTIIELSRLIGRPPPAMNLAIASSIPMGSGLSSSAALEVATALVCLEAMGDPLDPWALIRACQRAEHVHLGVPCGFMDQACSVLAKQGSALMLDCADMTTRTVPIPDDAAMLVIDSATPRALTDGRYAALRTACERASRIMGLHALSKATDALIASFEPHLAPDEVAAAKHVVSENARVEMLAEALAATDLPRAGRAMLDSHESLRDRLGVSCDELDLIVNTAMDQPGVYGSRLTGAGFGGCAIALIDPARAMPIATTIRERFARTFNNPCTTWLARPAAGASLIQPSDLA